MAFIALVHNGGLTGGQVHVGILGSSLVNRRHGVQGGEQAGSAGNHLGHVGGTLVSGHEIGVDQASVYHWCIMVTYLFQASM